MYGADVEALRTLAGRVEESARHLERTRAAVRGTVSTMRWQGADAEELRGRWSSQLEPALLAAAGTLEDVCAILRGNADQQESASTDGAVSGTPGAGASRTSTGSGPDGSTVGGPGVPAGDGGPAVTTSGGFPGLRAPLGLDIPPVKGSKSFTLGEGTFGGDPFSQPDEKPPGAWSDKVGVSTSHDLETNTSTLKLDRTASGSWTPEEGLGISGKANVAGSLSQGMITKDGVTTWTASGEVSVGVSGEVELKSVGIGGGMSAGANGSYSVAVPEGADMPDPRSVNPFDPASMPPGSTITMDGSVWTKTELEASYRALALASSVKEADGISTVVEKLDDATVRVTSGPTDALTTENGLGFKVGDDLSAMLVNKMSWNNVTLNTAEFDLSTAEGRAGYDDFLLHGRLPDEPGPGVSGTTLIEKYDYEHAPRLDLKAGPLSHTVAGTSTGMSGTSITYPDGSRDILQVSDNGNAPHVTSEFHQRSDGSFDPSRETLTYTFTADAEAAELLNGSDGWKPVDVGTPVRAGQTVTMTMDRADMGQLSRYTEQNLQAVYSSEQLGEYALHEVSPGTWEYDLARGEGGARKPAGDVAASLAAQSSHTSDFLSHLGTILVTAGADDGPRPFPGDVTVR